MLNEFCWVKAEDFPCRKCYRASSITVAIVDWLNAKHNGFQACIVDVTDYHEFDSLGSAMRWVEQYFRDKPCEK